MDDLEKLTARGRKFTFTDDEIPESKPTSFYVKPVKIRLHPELKEDSRSLLDEVYLQMCNEEEKAALDKWVARQFLDAAGKPAKLEDIVAAGATYDDVKSMITTMFTDSGFR